MRTVEVREASLDSSRHHPLAFFVFLVQCGARSISKPGNRVPVVQFDGCVGHDSVGQCGLDVSLSIFDAETDIVPCERWSP